MNFSSTALWCKVVFMCQLVGIWGSLKQNRKYENMFKNALVTILSIEILCHRQAIICIKTGLSTIESHYHTYMSPKLKFSIQNIFGNFCRVCRWCMFKWTPIYSQKNVNCTLKSKILISSSIILYKVRFKYQHFFIIIIFIMIIFVMIIIIIKRPLNVYLQCCVNFFFQQ